MSADQTLLDPLVLYAIHERPRSATPPLTHAGASPSYPEITSPASAGPRATPCPQEMGPHHGAPDMPYRGAGGAGALPE